MKFLPIILTLILTACKQADTLNKSDDFILEINFEQSFATPIKFHIGKSGNGATLYFTRTILDSVPPLLVSTDTAKLAEVALQGFFTRLKKVSLFSLPSDTTSSIGNTDGQTTRVIVVQGKGKHYFAFDHPSRKRHPYYYSLLDAAFDLMYHHFNKYEAEIEQNQEKLDYGLAIKRRGTNPVIIRMYGTYHNDSKNAQEYLYNLPKDKNIILDFTNLGTLTFIIEALTKIEKTHPKLTWVTGKGESDWAIRQILIDNGLDSTRMFRDTITAANWLIQKHGG